MEKEDQDRSLNKEWWDEDRGIVGEEGDERYIGFWWKNKKEKEKERVADWLSVIGSERAQCWESSQPLLVHRYWIHSSFNSLQRLILFLSSISYGYIT